MRLHGFLQLPQTDWICRRLPLPSPPPHVSLDGVTLESRPRKPERTESSACLAGQKVHHGDKHGDIATDNCMRTCTTVFNPGNDAPWQRSAVLVHSGCAAFKVLFAVLKVLLQKFVLTQAEVVFQIVQWVLSGGWTQ